MAKARRDREGRRRPVRRCKGRAQQALHGETCRFTTKGDALYAILLGWPANKTAIVKSLATSSPKIAGRKSSDVTLLGYSGS